MFNRLRVWGSRQPIIVVSGLPRSGTSMMMQMLVAGGIAALTDAHRPADASNPAGYYEYEPVKRLHHGETAWLPQARGRVVKVVSPHLVHLPADETYRVVFMQRDLAQVVASQQAMAARANATNSLDSAKLAADWERHLQQVLHWAHQQTHLSLLTVRYTAILSDPTMQSSRIADFLGGGLDVVAMAAAVDQSLFRHRGDD